MNIIRRRIIVEKPGAGRLGRHVEHNPQSRAFSVGTAAVKTVTYRRHGKPFDQGDLGSCTGNAMAGVLMTEPLWVPGRNLTEDDAVALYKAATKLDDIRGKYPPTDTGSSGLGVMKAAVKAKYIVGYAHSFSLEQLLGVYRSSPAFWASTGTTRSTRPSPMANARWLAPPRSVAGTRSSCSASTSRKSGYGATTHGDPLGAAARTALFTSRGKR